MPKNKLRYNARMRIYMQGYRKSQRDRLDQVLDLTSELLTILKANHILEQEVKTVECEKSTSQ